MALVRRFEELEIWQEARELHRVIWGEFKEFREFAFRDQIRRAALSVMNNIAEGFKRRTSKDFAHFLDLAKGSYGEVRSMSYASEDIGVLSQTTGSQLRAQSEALSQRIAAFSRHPRR
jgi:four helix bundle protein